MLDLDDPTASARALDAARRLVEEAEAPAAAQLARTGDLELRLGDPAVGIEHLARAAEMYADAGLLNLALALCHRILRTDSAPVSEYLRLGELSAAQGYAHDARVGFVEYADRSERAGDPEAARSALASFLRYFPSDTSVQRRLDGLGGGMQAPREESLVEPAVESIREPEPADEGDLGVIPTVLDATPAASAPTVEVAPLEGLESNHPEGAWSTEPPAAAAEAAETLDDALPLLGSDPEAEPSAVRAAEALPGAGGGGLVDPDVDHDLPLLGAQPEPIAAREPVTPESQPREAPPELRTTLQRPEPEYIDLGALILSDDLDLPTRVRIQADEPTGDDARDLEEILGLFRETVVQKIDPKDASSHYDLGLAFKEMGLYPDAIAQLQAALRAGAPPLATLEVLGECFIESGDADLAARLLERATQLHSAREEDLVGVRRLLDRAREARGFDKPPTGP